MIKIKYLTDKDIGKPIVYNPKPNIECVIFGIITGWNDKHIFIRSSFDKQDQVVSPSDLIWNGGNTYELKPGGRR